MRHGLGDDAAARGDDTTDQHEVVVQSEWLNGHAVEILVFASGPYAYVADAIGAHAIEKPIDTREAAQAIEQQHAALAEVVAREPWRARTNLEYWASQVAEGNLGFQDVVQFALAERLARVRAAGVQEIDYVTIHHKAIDDVVQAIDRYEAERTNEPVKAQELERGDDEEEELGWG
jgi:hypothetical protein